MRAGTAIAIALLAVFVCAQASGERRGDAATGPSLEEIVTTASATPAGAAATTLPAPVRATLGPSAPTGSVPGGWASLPATLDGRVTLRKGGGASNAGWTMLDVPGAARLSFRNGVMYRTAAYDVAQRVENRRIREYIVVRESQGPRLWRWKLHAWSPDGTPKIMPDGSVSLGGGYAINPPKVLDAAGRTIAAQRVHWKLRGTTLSLLVDDRGLALPYIIDPDVTAPTLSFTNWTESSPYAYYDNTTSITRLWYNPNQAGSATADAYADDPETGTAYVTFPSPGGGFSAGGSQSTGAASNGLIGNYYDNACKNQYPGVVVGCGNSDGTNGPNFSGTVFSRTDTDINFNWGAGTPYAALGIDTFSIQWVGQFRAPTTDTYFFQTNGDDGMRATVNGTVVVSAWQDQGATRDTACTGIALTAGNDYPILVEYYENGGSAVAQLYAATQTQINANTYRQPNGCTTPLPRFNYTTAFTGPGSSNYPLVPAAQFHTNSTVFSWNYSWTPTATASGNFNMTATNNGPNVLTSAGVPFNLTPDSTGPTGGAANLTATGWANSNTATVNVTATGADAGGSGVDLTLDRIEWAQGTPDGANGCTFAAPVWTTAVAAAAAGNNNITLAANKCYQFRYITVDNVGNETINAVAGFKGYDVAVPTISFNSYVPGANPQYQYWSGVGTTMFFNGNQSGSFDVKMNAADTASGIQYVTFPNPGGTFNAGANISGASPYTYTYSWTATATNPGAINAQARDWVNRTTNGAFTLTRDVTNPNGGSVVYPNSWINTASYNSVTGTASADGGSGVKNYQLQYEKGTWSGVCTYAGGWVNAGAATVGTPNYTMAGLVSGDCVHFQTLVSDNVGNVQTVSSANILKVDTVAPTGTLNATPPTAPNTAVKGNAVAFTGTDADALSGVASLSIDLYTGGGAFVATVCNMAAPAAAFTCPNWNSALVADGTYQLRLNVTDNAGNVATNVANRALTVDNSAAPAFALSYTELVNPGALYANLAGTTMWFNPNAGAVSFDVTATPTDAHSGIQQVQFNNVANGEWTPNANQIDLTAPFKQTYTGTPAPAPIGDPAGNHSVIATNGAGTTTTTTFTIDADATAPAGHTTGNLNGYYTLGTGLSVPYTAATDAQSGIATWQLQRSVGTLTAGACVGFGGYINIGVGDGTDANPYSDTVIDGKCYRYQVAYTDNVGNTSAYVGSGNTTKVDLSAPTGTIAATPPIAPNTAVKGNAVVFTGTDADAYSGVASLTVALYTGGGAFVANVCTLAAPAAAYTCPAWNSTTVVDGTYQLRLNATDGAGNVGTNIANRPLIVDNAAPSITLSSATAVTGAAYQYADVPGKKVYVNPAFPGSVKLGFTATDTTSGIKDVAFPTLGANWSPVGGAVANPGPYEYTYAWVATAANNPAQVFTATDNAGSTGIDTVDILADSAKPTGGTISYPNGYTGAPLLTFSPGTDALSGVAHWQLERRDTTLTTGTCNAGGWSGWTAFMAPDQPSTQTDGTVVSGHCYEYHITVTDNVGNSDTFTSASTAKVDVAGVTVTQSAGSTDVTEGGATDTYTVVLNTPPSANVTVTLTPDSQVTASAPTLTFTPANWSTPQTVTVTAVNDAVHEGAHTGTIAQSATSADLTYNGIAVANVTANITDDDTASVTITESGGSTAVTEGGATDSYQIVLTSQPSANVTVTVSPDAQVTTGPGSAVFTPANWNVAQVITVTAVDDPVHEGAHTGTITHSVASGDPDYSAFPLGNVTANITDNDTASVTVTPSGGSTAITEGGATDTYDVVLTSQPSANVTITLTPNAQVTASAPTLTFTPGNWNTPQTVTVTAVDDAIDEGAHTGTVSHTAASTDPDYSGVAVAGLTANITDNDTASIVVVESGGSTDIAEGGATDTYTVKLGSQPTANVTVNIGVDAQSTAAPVSLTFTPANYNTTQTVTITAVDDFVAEGLHTSAITNVGASADPKYAALGGPGVTANITDNDTAGATVVESGASTDVAEGGATDTYTVVLTSKPTANVTVTPSNPGGQTTTAPAALTFTPVNWNVAQTVTVTAVDDFVFEGPHTGTVAMAVASADPFYAVVTIPNLTANITDNDTPGVAFVQSGGTTTVTEGGATDTFTAVLSSMPSANVTITVTPDAQSTVAPTTLTFTPANWNVAQTVTVTAVDDALVEGAHSSVLAHSIASGDATYAGLMLPNITAAVTDNDVAGVTLVQSGGSTDVVEGGATDTFTAVLTAQPTANVTIAVAGNAQVTAGPASLTFTPANWNVAQTVTVTAIDDAVVEGAHTGSVSLTVTSPDGNFNALSAGPVTANITDNDTASVTVTQSGGTTNVTEGGAGDSYDVVLGSQPTANVTITVTPDAQVSAAPASLTFTPANWNVAQTVTVSAVDDAVAEGAHSGVLTHAATSADPVYNGFAVGSVTAAVTDNDSASVIVTESGGATNVTEGGATDTYTVKLSSAPTGNVTITVTGDAQATAAPASLTFTPANYGTAQTVTVTAVNDAVAEGPHTGTIGMSAASADLNYNGLAISAITANITDNDTAGVTFAESGGSTDVSEIGATDTYTAVLTSQPTGNVVITGTADAQTTISGALTFTPANWNVPQTFTAGAIDDAFIEGPHTGTITHAASGADAMYTALSLGSVTANITDNDVAGVIVTESAGSTAVSEAGGTDTYDVVLTAAPSSNVTVTPTPDAQTTAAPASLTFTPLNWATPQTVTVGAVDDAVAEGAHTGTLTNIVASGDVNYSVVTAASVTANITDNDIAGVSIVEAGGTSIAEGGATDTYTIVLNTQPTANVTITPSADAQSTIAPASVTFTAGNWNVPQTITVTAIDDLVAEGPHTSTISHAIASADGQYSALIVPPVTAAITDNDTAGITVVESAGSTDVVEGGATDSFTVVLTSQPTASVNVVVTPNAQVNAAPLALTFTTGNWNVAQTVTASAIDDAVAEGPHTGSYALAAASADTFYSGLAGPGVTANITDNDSAGIAVVQSGGTTDVAEGGATDTFTVALTSQPTANVTVTPTPDAQSTVAPASLTFTPANWNVAQTITVTAVDDLIFEGAHTSAIALNAASADTFYSGLAGPGVTANITDNDIPGFTVTESGGTTAVAEGGATDTFDAVLTSQPTTNVTITLTPDAQVTTSAPTLTFTPLDWNVPQTVTVTAVDDAVAEGLHSGSVAYSFASGDAAYAALVHAATTASITDNDTAGVTFTQSAGSTDVTEGGATDTYDVVLTSQPIANVTVNLTPNAQVTVGAPSLTFTPANWNVAQTVTVTAVDDAVAEGAHTGSVAHAMASMDPTYAALTPGNVTANITDNDSAGITVTESAGSTSIAEGGATDTYDVVLTSQPTGAVTITLTPDTQVTTAPVSLVFTPANWNVARTVTVTAVDDAVAEGPHTGTVTHAATSPDPNYNAVLIAPVVAAIADNDAPGVTLVESGGSTDVAEGGATDTYTVKLNTMPTANVTLTVAGDAQATAAPASLTFTPANWNIAQTVTITAVQDAVAEGPHTGIITTTVASVDPFYAPVIVPNVTANIADDDSASVDIVESGGSTDVAEGGATDTYTMVLHSQPTANVTITITPDAQVTAAPASLTFTPVNWNVAQTVTVTAVDDFTVEGSHTGVVSHAVASGDASYNGAAVSNVTANITDNDTPSVTIVESAGSTDVTEGGATDTYTVVLGSMPTANVDFALNAGTQVTTAPANLTFTPANWNVPQTVTVTAVDDFVHEGAHTGTIAYVLTSADAVYNGFAVPSTTANITDNDTAGVTVTQSGGTTAIAEGGATDAYDVVLTSQPTANVTITITPDAQITTSTATLTFTPANWNVAQPVTVTAVDDAVAEGAHTGVASHLAASTDPDYSGIAVAPVSAAITDNDVAGFTVTESGGSTDVAEGGATDSYDVVLTSQPTANVTVTLTPNAQVTVGAPSLTFTPANWNVAQTVTVTAVDDFVAEGAHTGSVAHAVASGDATYGALTIPTVTANITDNDSAGVTVTESAGSTAVTEGGANDTFDVVLTSQPTANVTVTLSTDAQVVTGVPSLTFTPANWNVAQTVTVLAVDDFIAEGAHTGVTSFAFASPDGNYAAMVHAPVTAAITDNDVAGVSVVESGGSTDIAEGGATDTYDVKLTSQPTASVDIAVTPDAQVTGAPVTLTFTPGNWNVAQTVTATAVDDALIEGAHSGTLSHVVTSADATYNGIGSPSVTATITDNDMPGIILTETGGTTDVSEAGGTDTYTLVLTAMPTANVDVAIAGDSQASAVPAAFTFTPATWNVPRTVTISAIDDFVAEGAHTGTISHVVTSADVNFAPITIPDVTANITDNDTAGVSVIETGGTSVAEGGATDTYDVVLNSQPTGAVTITVTSAPQLTTAPTVLTFTPANWNVAQTVTVTAVDDAMAEGPHTGTITHAIASPDPVYNALVVAGVTANIADNDTVGIDVTESGGSTDVAEGGATDTYDVVLHSQPSADVTVTISPDAQVNATPLVLTFTNLNWNVAQTVTASAIDDFVAEGAHIGTFAMAAASADTGYSGLAGPAFTANIADNDSAGIDVTESGGSTDVAEGGATDTFGVTLHSQPTANVTVTLGPDAQVTTGAPTLTFTPANWNVAQNVTVTAVDDLVFEGPHTGVITTSAGSVDPNYGALAGPSVTANITDNDTPGVDIVESGASTDASESGVTDTYTVVLHSQPTANVTITLTPDAQATAAPATLTFTPLDWNVPQTVTAGAVDDAVAEGIHTGSIAYAMASADAAYAALTPAATVVNILDNDTPGITVTESAGSTDIAEGGATDTYDVVLTSQPIANVSVNLTPDAQVTVGAPSLTFTPGNWNVPQTVTVTAVDDAVAEGSHSGSVAQAVASMDPVYAALTMTPVTANITDNDTAGITLTESAGSTDVTEGGATDTYDLVLTSQPTANVDITVSPDAQVTSSPAVVTFTPANWNTPQSVTVTAVDDAVFEGPHLGTVSHSVASADAAYGVLALAPVVANITDNDVAGITLTETAGSTDVVEGGATDTYDLVLTSQPTANVDITILGDAQATAGPLMITFTPANWNVVQSVTVTAVNDAVSEGAHTGTIVHAVSSLDPAYAPLTVPNVTANITDDDSSGVDITETGGTTDVAEGAATDTYDVVLHSQPTANVTITVTGDAQATAAPASLTFTPANWNVAQTVTVTAVDDLIAEGAHVGTITHTDASADPNYNGGAISNVVANITDNDTPGITVTESAGSTDVTEGGATDTYDIVLQSMPTANVDITLAPDAQVSVGAPTVTFTPANWNVPQTVTVTAVDDAVHEGAHTGTVTQTVASADAGYAAIVLASITANITDNDTAGVTVTESAGSTDVTEGGATDTYDVVLTSQPTAIVDITVAGDSQITLSSPTLTFTPANWNVPQPITVTAVDDAVAEGAHTGVASHLAVSTDPDYSGIAVAPVTANITDNDTAGVTFTESGGTTDVAEGGATDSYDVVLTSQPTASMNITVTPDAQVTAAPTTLTFTPANWNTPQTVTVTAVDDAVAEGPHTGTLAHTIAGADTTYAALVLGSVTANITDNDSAGAVVVESGGSTDVDEAGISDDFTMVLTSQPTADVTVTLSPDAQITTTPATLTFTSANWNVPQTVTVDAVDDDIDEGGIHPGVLTFSFASADPTYAAVTHAPLTVNVDDDDTAGISIDESPVSTDVDEGGVTDTYDVVLDSQPLADVTITLVADAQVTTDVATLTFTALNWNTPQTVTVTAVDDAVIEGLHTGLITHTSASMDPNYTGNVISDVVPNITDNDVPVITITESGGTTDVTEGGANDTYDVVLGSQPSAPVTITLGPDAQVAGGPGVLTFDSLNWNIPQTVTVTAIDDFVHEGSHTGTITHTVTSGDANYNGLAVSSVTANITDNDTAGVSITESGGSTDVTEGGATDTYDVVLTSQPTANVDVTVAGDTQIGVAPVTLTFTPLDWNIAQSVTVTAVDDAIAEGLHTGTATATVASTDPDYGGAAVAPVTANITDNDTAGITVTETGGSTDVAEGGATDTYDVVLTSQPTANVDVTITGDAQVSAAPLTLTFTPANWNVAQSVTVMAIDDAVMEGAHTGTVTGTVASADATYAAATVSAVTANITDNDTAGITVTESGGTTDVFEGGATDSYDIVLTSQPTADVTITFTPDAQVTTDVPSLTFTSANWNTPQTVTVTAVDDALIEGPHTGLIAQAVASADTNYAPLTLADVTANITDNDAAGVTITETGGTTDVTEGGAGDTYDVVLTAQPTANVDVTMTPDAQVTAGPATLTFTPANWNVPQTVTVTAVDDFIAEGPHTGTIAHSTTSGDVAFNALVVGSVTANITDNDTVGVDVVESGGTTDVTEGGANDTYDVTLHSQPLANVDITLTPDAQVTATPTTLTFTPADWNVPQTVTIDAVDDLVAEGPHTGSVAYALVSTDPAYAALTPTATTVNITDNDSAGIVVTESGGTTDVDESGVTDSVDVMLSSQPTANVDITVTFDAQLGAGPTTLTFTPLDWNVPQTVTINAVDDAIAEGPHTGVATFTATGADAMYAALTPATVTANITDNDTAGITVTESAGSTDVAEGGATDSYDVVLTSQPLVDVVITLTPDAQVTTDVTTLTFTPANWSTPQTVTVTAVDDPVTEGPHTGSIAAAVSAVGDANYDLAVVAPVTANITDNDNAAIVVTESGGTTDVAEGGATDSYDVVLASQPSADVTITLTPDAQVTTDVPTLTFTSADWNVPQTVTVTAVDDAVIEGLHSGTIAQSVASADPMYAVLTMADVTAGITDNDFPDLKIDPVDPSVDVTEGGATDTYELSLTAQPTADVDVTINPDGQVSTDVTTVTFTTANWNVPQIVTVTAVDDFLVEGPHAGLISHITSSADPNFDLLTPPDLVANVTDNDFAGVVITESGGSTDVAEAGSGDTYQVALTAEPGADVTVTLTPDAQVSTAPITLTFTPLDWNIPQVVTVDAIDDFIVEGPHTGTITHTTTSADPAFDSLTVPDVVASIVDNDVPGVNITESGGSTDVTEGGATDTFDVVLTSEPVSPVTVTIKGDAQVNATDIVLTFDSTNWNVVQTVTVTAIDDNTVEGSHTGTLSAVVASADPLYDLGVNATITANITDDDTAGIKITQTAGSTDVTEGGATDTYDVVLLAKPAASVTVTPTGDAQVGATPTPVIFTPGTWNVPKTITVRAVDDPIVEGPHTGTISHTSTSADPMFDALTLTSLTANITDNDVAKVIVKESSGTTNVSESGNTDTYTIELATQPSADVTINATPDTQVGVSQSTVTFTPADWNVPQELTVAAVDDLHPEGPHTGTIAHTVTSADVNYAAVAAASVVANIADNDTAGVTLTQTDSSTKLAEGGASDTYTVVLTAQPRADVTVRPAPDGQVMTAPPSLTFTSVNWNVPQTITATAVDDAVAELSPHPGKVKHTTASTDTMWDNLTVDTIDAQITDNDTAGVVVTETKGSTKVTEGGAGDSISISLKSQPTEDVTVQVAGDEQVKVDKETITISPGTWNDSHVVHVTAIDDTDVEGAHHGFIELGDSSADKSYDNNQISSVDVKITDNDKEGSGATSDGGDTGGKKPETKAVIPKLNVRKDPLTSSNQATSGATTTSATVKPATTKTATPAVKKAKPAAALPTDTTSSAAKKIKADAAANRRKGTSFDPWGWISKYKAFLLAGLIPIALAIALLRMAGRDAGAAAAGGNAAANAGRAAGIGTAGTKAGEASRATMRPPAPGADDIDDGDPREQARRRAAERKQAMEQAKKDAKKTAAERQKEAKARAKQNQKDRAQQAKQRQAEQKQARKDARNRRNDGK